MKKALAAVFTVFTVTLCVLLRGGLIASIAASVPIAPARAEAADDSLEQQIVAKEREGLDALKAGDLTLFGNLTADDAVFVDSRGPAGKAQVMSNVAGFRITEYTMADVKYLRISRDSGLISYKITEKGVSHGKEFAAQVYVSSIWAKRGGKWACLFSQETEAR